MSALLPTCLATIVVDMLALAVQLASALVNVNAIFFHAMPRFSRPDILFAVTVPDAFVAGAGRAIVVLRL